MVERISEMPSGRVGFRARGKLTRDDYRETSLRVEANRDRDRRRLDS
jgi:hypothetical protein